LADPNYKCSQEDYEAQLNFLLKVHGKFNEIIKGIKDIRSAKSQMNDFVQKQGSSCPADVKQLADSLSKSLSAIEDKLHQTKAKSGQDVLNFPIRLDDKIGGVFDMANSGNMAPAKQSIEVFNELSSQANIELEKIKVILTEGVSSFNKLISAKGLPTVVVK
jgi:ABC-type transporter Mla subunit MlaD